MSERRESRIADFLDRCADVFFKYAVPPNIVGWPRWERRAFVLTLPVSLPLWLAWWVALFLAMGVFAFGVIILGAAFWVYLPIAGAFITIREIWEA